MRALLDVSVLLALFDPAHLFHGRARAWWSAHAHHGWASTPTTQNGFLRIVTQPSYPKPVAFPVALALLRAQTTTPAHEPWPDEVSILDPAAIDPAHVLGPRQLTDICLLATAVRRGGRFVTLDARITTAAVRGARPEHLLVVPHSSDKGRV
jgi:toxin-antitoxin system PIN domain toxin